MICGSSVITWVSRLRSRGVLIVAGGLLAGLLAVAGQAHAAGGNYTIVGGAATEQEQVQEALAASAFDWSLVPAQITIYIAPGLTSEATPGNIWLDANLLDSGRFSWGVVQHEYAHQVDFFLLDADKRALLQRLLGAKDWCYGVSGLPHSAYGCERFASTLAWAYWPSPDNSMQPTSKADEAAAMPPPQFRALLSQLIGAPATPRSGTVGFAPAAKRLARLVPARRSRVDT